MESRSSKKYNTNDVSMSFRYLVVPRGFLDLSKCQVCQEGVPDQRLLVDIKVPKISSKIRFRRGLGGILAWFTNYVVFLHGRGLLPSSSENTCMLHGPLVRPMFGPEKCSIHSTRFSSVALI